MSDQKQLPFADDPAAKKLAPKPPGILPKNAQTLVVLGISVVMVLAIALSGGPSSRSGSNAAAPKQQQVIDPNAARIAEYRDRIEEQTRRLEAEQARLNQAREAFQRAIERGEVRPDADIDSAVEWLGGAITVRAVQGRPLPTVEDVPRLVGFTLRGVLADPSGYDASEVPAG